MASTRKVNEQVTMEVWLRRTTDQIQGDHGGRGWFRCMALHPTYCTYCTYCTAHILCSISTYCTAHILWSTFTNHYIRSNLQVGHPSTFRTALFPNIKASHSCCRCVRWTFVIPCDFSGVRSSNCRSHRSRNTYNPAGWLVNPAGWLVINRWMWMHFYQHHQLPKTNCVKVQQVSFRHWL